jgi:hypothetical protein
LWGKRKTNITEDMSDLSSCKKNFTNAGGYGFPPSDLQTTLVMSQITNGHVKRAINLVGNQKTKRKLNQPKPQADY